MRTTKKNKLDGPIFEYFENKKPKLKGLYTNGFKNGEWIEYYENGNTFKIYNYMHDRLGGNYIENYENGNIKAEGMYAGNKKYKKWKYYNEDGKVNITEVWKRGELIKTSEK